MDSTELTLFTKSISLSVKDGEDLLENNSFFKDLSELLETPQFTKFLHKHMNSTGEIQSSMIYIKLYDSIKRRLPIQLLEDPETTKKLITIILYNFITNSKYRKNVIQTTIDHMDSGSNKDLIDCISRKILYEKYLNTGIVIDPEILIDIHKEEIKKLKKLKKIKKNRNLSLHSSPQHII